MIITDGYYSVRNSVGIYRQNYRWNIQNFKKKKGSLTWKFLWAILPMESLKDSNQDRSLYGDVTNSLSKLSMESPTDSFGRWFHRQKWIYHHFSNSLLPYFSFFFPIPTLPSQTANNHAPKKNLPLLNTSHISLSFVVIASVFWFIVDFIIFCK